MRKPAKPVINPPEAIYMTAVEGRGILNFDGGRIEVSADGKKIDIYTSKSASRKVTVVTEADRKDAEFGVSKDAKKFNVNGIIVTRVADGKLVVDASKGTVVMQYPLVIPGPVLKIGDFDKDGWRYGGISKTTGKPMWVAPKDAGRMTLRRAFKAAARLRKEGKHEARVPSAAEVDQIRRNLAAIGGFDITSAEPYLSSSVRTVHKYLKDKTHTIVDCQRFNNGGWIRSKKRAAQQVRFVRS
jgi:hypothetical protein